MISARMETAVSSGVCAPMSRPTGPGDARELLLRDARLAQPVAALLLRAARAESADVADPAAQRARDGRVVQLRVVREHDDVILGPQLDDVVALLGPFHDDLVGRRNAARPSRTRCAGRSPRCASRARRSCGRAASAVSTAPTTTTRGDGTSASAKIRPSSSSRTVWLRSAEIASSPAADDPVAPAPRAPRRSRRPAVTKRVRAGVVAVDRPVTRRGALGRDLPALVALDPDPDLAAAREADVPGLVVRDAVEEELRRARPSSTLWASADDRALDAAAGDGAGHLAARADGELGAERARSGAARAHDGGQRDLVAARAPAVGGAEGVFVHAATPQPTASRQWTSPRRSPREPRPASRARARLWPGRKSSTYGSAACMPATSGR